MVVPLMAPQLFFVKRQNSITSFLFSFLLSLLSKIILNRSACIEIRRVIGRILAI